MFTKEMVDELADKLLIGLTDEENKMVLDDFEMIKKDIDIVKDIEGIENVEPQTHCLLDMPCNLNNDEVEETPDIEDLLKNSDQTIGREIEVVKVV